MAQTAYNIKKLSGIGLSVVTLLNIATISPNMYTNSLTANTSAYYSYAAVPTYSDDQGELCISSMLADEVRGDVLLSNGNIDEYVPKHKKMNVKLKITKITKHVSKFDFEEEYEEI